MHETQAVVVPCAASKHAPSRALSGCEQVVGKVVISFVQTARLYKTYTAALRARGNYVFTIPRLLAYFKQATHAYAHLFLAFLEVLSDSFYTLPTGPTNTNKLNKGVN
jgi:hypothetical protein